MKHPLVPAKANSSLTTAAFAKRVKIPLAPNVERSRETAANASALATRRAYSSDWRIFSTWCVAHGRVPLPCEEQTLCDFNLARLEAGCSIRTVQRGMVSVRARQTLAGFEDPFNTYARAHWRGLRKDWYKHPGKAAPLLTADVHKMVDKFGRQRLHHIRARALLLVGFYGGMRRGEVVAIRREDITFVDKPEFKGMDLNIPRSKTDQDGSKGVRIAFEATGTDYCPVEAIKLWLLVTRINSGFVFQSVRGRRRLTQKPLAAWRLGALVQGAALAAGLQPDEGKRFTGHSLRAGCATQLYLNGVPEVDIMRHLRHTNAKQTRGYDRRGIATRSRTMDLDKAPSSSK